MYKFQYFLQIKNKKTINNQKLDKINNQKKAQKKIEFTCSGDKILTSLDSNNYSQLKINYKRYFYFKNINKFKTFFNMQKNNFFSELKDLKQKMEIKAKKSVYNKKRVFKNFNNQSALHICSHKFFYNFANLSQLFKLNLNNKKYTKLNILMTKEKSKNANLISIIAINKIVKNLCNFLTFKVNNKRFLKSIIALNFNQNQLNSLLDQNVSIAFIDNWFYLTNKIFLIDLLKTNKKIASSILIIYLNHYYKLLKFFYRKQLFLKSSLNIETLKKKLKIKKLNEIKILILNFFSNTFKKTTMLYNFNIINYFKLFKTYKKLIKCNFLKKDFKTLHKFYNKNYKKTKLVLNLIKKQNFLNGSKINSIKFYKNFMLDLLNPLYKNFNSKNLFHNFYKNRVKYTEDTFCQFLTFPLKKSTREILQYLWKWSKKQHNQKPLNWIFKKYWLKLSVNIFLRKFLKHSNNNTKYLIKKISTNPIIFIKKFTTKNNITNIINKIFFIKNNIVRKSIKLSVKKPFHKKTISIKQKKVFIKYLIKTFFASFFNKNHYHFLGIKLFKDISKNKQKLKNNLPIQKSSNKFILPKNKRFLNLLKNNYIINKNTNQNFFYYTYYLLL